MLGWSVMKATLVLLGLVACGGESISANWDLVGPQQYAVSDCVYRECLRAARAACPYGYDQVGSSNDGASATSAPATMFTPAAVNVSRNKTIVVQCRPPVWCDAAACAYGYRCVVSRHYPGHNVCSL